MKIDSILSGIRQSQETAKTASENAAAPSQASAKVAASSNGLMDALNTALNAAPASVKTAGVASTPVNDVMKVAEEIAATEQDAQVKQAQVMGAAFADAFVARLGAWQSKAAELNTQMPSDALAGMPSYGKFASENSGLVSQSQRVGYAQTQQALEKQANDAYVDGFNDTTTAIHKTASIEFLKGAAMMRNVLAAVAG